MQSMVEKASEAMYSSSSDSDVGSTEDVVQALLEYLVDPMLPLKSSARETPTLSQQKSVAKQVHAVVLLYNYYLRRKHAEVEFLNFESFCKLAVTLRPSLMAHMKVMHRSDYTELEDLENQFSLTEKAIMDACDLSLVLDASKDVPSTEKWPISKVAVLLIDSRKENCVVEFSSITHGVWSVIEKDLDVSNTSSEDAVEGKHINRRKRITRKPLRDEYNADEAGFQQLAYSAIKEVMDINQTDLMILESHVVYSTSKEKTAAWFYLVQCTKSINEDLQVPIKDVIDSLQGPLVKKSSCSWTVTPVVEYFHVLPYARIISGWLSREMFSSSVQDLSSGMGDVNANSSQKTENSCDKEVVANGGNSNENCGAADSIESETNGANTESPKLKNNNGCHTFCSSDSIGGPHGMDVEDSSAAGPRNEDTSKKICNAVEVYPLKNATSSVDNAINSSTSGIKVQVDHSISTSTSFMVKRRALLALGDLYKAAKGSKSSGSTSISSARIPIAPSPSEEILNVAKEQLLKFLSKDVREIPTFQQSLATALSTLLKNCDFPSDIKIVLSKLQHQLPSISSNVSSSIFTFSEVDQKIQRRDEAYDNFRKSLDCYPDFETKAEELAKQKETLVAEMNRIQKELERVKQEENELDQQVNAVYVESEEYKKVWEKLSDDLPRLEDAKAQAVELLAQSRHTWVEFQDQLSSI